MKDGFHHCCVMYFDAKNKSEGVVVNFGMNKICIQRYDYKEVLRLINSYYECGGCVLFGEISPNKVINARYPLSLEPYNCVALTKKILGIKKRFIWTPYGLYKLLVNKHNFIEVNIMGGDVDPEVQEEEQKQEALTEQLQAKQKQQDIKTQDQELEQLRRSRGGSGGSSSGSNVGTGTSNTLG